MTCAQSWCICNTSATISTLCATSSGCGDTVDIYLAYMSEAGHPGGVFGDEIDRITEFNPVTGARQNVVKHVAIFPASHYIVSAEKKPLRWRRYLQSATLK